MQMKHVSAMAGAFGYGILVGWALTADHLENKFNSRIETLERRVDLLRDRTLVAEGKAYAYDKLLLESDETAPPVGSNVSDQPEPAETDLENAPGGVTDEASGTDEDDGISGESERETRTRLQGLISTYTDNPDDRDDFVNTGTAFERDDTPPFVIPVAKYAHDEDEGDMYLKITLKYFPRHRVLLDDEEEPVDDIPNTIGWKNLRQFGGESNDPDTVFIRNRRLHTDFEVIKDEENELPLHVQFGLPRETYRAQRAAGLIKGPPEERD